MVVMSPPFFKFAEEEFLPQDSLNPVGQWLSRIIWGGHRTDGFNDFASSPSTLVYEYRTVAYLRSRLQNEAATPSQMQNNRGEILQVANQ